MSTASAMPIRANFISKPWPLPGSNDQFTNNPFRDASLGGRETPVKGTGMVHVT
jgi:hypothetical protein